MDPDFSGKTRILALLGHLPLLPHTNPLLSSILELSPCLCHTSGVFISLLCQGTVSSSRSNTQHTLAEGTQGHEHTAVPSAYNGVPSRIRGETSEWTLSISRVPTMVTHELGATSVEDTPWSQGAFHLGGVRRLRIRNRPNKNWGEQSDANSHAAHSENLEKGE